MPSFDFAVAAAIAQANVQRLSEMGGDQYEIVSAQVINGGWVFFFNTSEFVRTGDPLACLAGNGPILVSRDGSVHELSSASPWEKQVEEILGHT